MAKGVYQGRVRPGLPLMGEKQTWDDVDLSSGFSQTRTFGASLRQARFAQIFDMTIAVRLVGEGQPFYQ